MNNYLSYLIEANIGLLLFALAYIVFLRQEQIFLLKRLLLLGMMTAAAVLPLLSFHTAFSSLPTDPMGMNGYYLPAILLTAEKATTPATHESLSLLTICLWVYWAIVSVLFIQFTLRIAALLKQRSTGRFVKNVGSVKVYEVDSTDYAFSFFNHVFIGQLSDLDEHSKNKIIAHELAHYKEWHSLDILFVELLRILFWFNPSIYMLKKALVETHEYRADELSISKGEEQLYCSLIARLALTGAGYHIANHFNKSLTLKRIAMIKSMKQKTGWWKLAAFAPILGAFFIAVSCQEQGDSTVANQYPKEVQADIPTFRKMYPDKEFVYMELSADEARSSLGDGYILLKTYAISEDKQGYLLASLTGGEVFTLVEEVAQYPEGIQALYQFMSSNLKYPAIAKNKGTEGKVLVEFVVEKDGRITNLKITSGIGDGCDEEAMRVIETSAPWTPAQQRGKKVRQRMILPINFSLTANTKSDAPSHATLVNDKFVIDSYQVKQVGNIKEITGKIKLESGEAIPGTNIILAGTTAGTVSDRDGSFKLQTSLQSGEVVFSFVGFDTKKLAF
ncbi:MAG: TonB family protein [Imperialibacter sp.]|uniref:TonB family protein n=1 Tax=Imperialibacter sp. TaxID=2038411 RepID=UPI0032F080D9